MAPDAFVEVKSFKGYWIELSSVGSKVVSSTYCESLSSSLDPGGVIPHMFLFVQIFLARVSVRMYKGILSAPYQTIGSDFGWTITQAFALFMSLSIV